MNTSSTICLPAISRLILSFLAARYYIIIENDDYRKMFRQAVEKSNNFKDTYIPNINADSPTGIEEGIYHTRELHIDNQTPLLMGFSDTAKDDYLNMLRNHVGKTGTMLSDYAIIFVLSNNNMESLTTASVNLESATYPLNSNEIRSNIERTSKTQQSSRMRESIYVLMSTVSPSSLTTVPAHCSISTTF